MMDVEGVEDDGDAILKSIATKTERLVFTWPIRCLIHSNLTSKLVSSYAL